ncbi:FHA domain-containing protein [Pseudomonas sp. S30]|uniref:FHA domain-containing protein n=2 Tax=unclassified Pseudomonas TaxID=196821 RepID=UPI001F4072A3|nr:FHA domain-containing protein [Pseudomonas sp. S30]
MSPLEELAMFELRVLSGLHRGAALPLVGDEWTVGAAPDVDLALYDPGICARHVRLVRDAGQWRLELLDGAAGDAQGHAWVGVRPLSVDTRFVIAGIWLCLAAAEEPWPQGAPADSAGAGADLAATARPAPRPSWPRRLAIAAAVITVASSAWAFTSQPAPPVKPEPAQATERRKVLLDDVATVRRQLDRMLQERDLAGQVQVELREDRLVLVGELPRQRLAVVERLLARFQDRYSTPVPVIAKVREQLTRLPFQIAQIVGGKRGHVVTGDGRRLFLGDQIDGLRLTAIGNDKVTFEGEQRYEVTW